MLRALGPLGQRLEEHGITLVAPNAAHRMDEAELSPIMTWMSGRYREAGQDVGDTFKDGMFWDPGQHYDWFQSKTDPQTGKKHYQALEESVERVATAIRNRPVVGVIGFSQGAAMAVLLAARATRGDERFAGLRFGMFLSGFKPVFDAPTPPVYPAGPFRRLFAIGERDPLFPGNAEYLASVSAAFEGEEQELIVVPQLGHEVPASPAVVEQLARFALL